MDNGQFHDFPVPRRWRARWIWASGDGQVKNGYYLFRTEVSLPRVPEWLRLYISADTRYQLYANGRFVGRGVPQSQPYFQYYDEQDLSAYLAAGANCIGVIVNHVGNLPDTRGGLLAELVDVDGRVLLATGPDWRVRRADAWREKTFYFRMNQTTPYQEVFDARRMPGGWSSAGFDDGEWERCRVVSGRLSDRPSAVEPWTRLVPRDIPHMTSDPVLPVGIVYTEECLDIANRLRPEDLSIALSTRGSAIRYSLLEGADTLCAQESAAVARCSTDHLDRVFDGVYDPCLVLDFGRVITAYPRVELDGVAGGMLDIGYAERLLDGHFNNALEGQFADRYVMVDGPQVYQPFTWKAFRYLKLRFRSCFEPVTVRSLVALVTTYPFEERGRFHSADEVLNGVFDMCRYTLRLCSNEFIMDTPWREQAQWLEALVGMARLKQDRSTERKVDRLMAGMRDSFQARLFDPERGCFADARVDGAFSPKTSEHANAAAICWGLCDDATATAIISRLYEQKSVPYTEAQPFFTTVVLQALDRVGRFDLALELIRERWGGRMLARGATSTYEEWGINGSWRSGEYQGFLRTLSHAWSAHPAEFLIRYLVGLKILEPGCRKVGLRPQETSFDYDVTFPTPHGPIRVQRAGEGVEIFAPDEIEVVNALEV